MSDLQRIIENAEELLDASRGQLDTDDYDLRRNLIDEARAPRVAYMTRMKLLDDALEGLGGEEKKCEFGLYNIERGESVPCGKPATVYGGYAGAGGWAGYACDECSTAIGFNVWDRITTQVEGS